MEPRLGQWCRSALQPSATTNMACGSFRRRRSSCASSFSRWQRSCCSPRSRARTRRSRSEHWTAAATTRSTRTWGQANTQYSGSPANYADGRREAGRRPARAVRQQPDLQRREPEPVLRERRHPMGLRLGPVPRPHVRPARGGGRRERADRRSTPADPLEDFTNDLGLDPVHPLAGRARHRHEHSTARADQHRQLVHRRFGRLRRQRRRGSMAARGPGRRQPRQQQRRRCCCRTATCPRRDARGNAATAPDDGARGPAAGRARQARSSPATCGRTRTSRSPPPTRCSRASTTGSSPRCRAALPEETKFQIARRGRHRRAAVHHLQRVPARARREAARVPRLQRRRERRASANEFADGRLPRAQHDPRRVRVEADGGRLHRRAAGRARGAGRRGRGRGRRGRARRSR